MIALRLILTFLQNSGNVDYLTLNVKRSIANVAGIRDFLLSWVVYTVCSWQIGLPVARGKDRYIFITQYYTSSICCCRVYMYVSVCMSDCLSVSVAIAIRMQGDRLRIRDEKAQIWLLLALVPRTGGGDSWALLTTSLLWCICMKAAPTLSPSLDWPMRC